MNDSFDEVLNRAIHDCFSIVADVPDYEPNEGSTLWHFRQVEKAHKRELDTAKKLLTDYELAIGVLQLEIAELRKKLNGGAK